MLNSNQAASNTESKTFTDFLCALPHSLLSAPDRIQYRFLRWLSPGEPRYMSGEPYKDRSKIRVLLGDQMLDELRGKTVVDFGCGEGEESVSLAKGTAFQVIGLDIRENVLKTARERAQREGVAERCHFCTHTDRPVDAIVSLDAFEHFGDPAAVLRMMYGLLKPGGAIYVSFGPTWYHPFGGHLFSVFPWAHLIFSENALLLWRSHIYDDGATRFSEVAGGLNQITISRFERLVQESPLKFEFLDVVPIRRLRVLHNRLTREFTTSIVRCKLIAKPLVARPVTSNLPAPPAPFAVAAPARRSRRSP